MSEESGKNSKSLFAVVSFAASVAMNAISLINIGRDFKVTIVRWTEFFISLFEFGNKIADYLFKPFSFLFDVVNISVETSIKNLYTIAFITLFGLLERRSNRQVKNGFFTKVLTVITSALLAVVLACIALILGWFMSIVSSSSSSYDISASIVGILVLVVILIFATRDKEFKSYMTKYAGSILTLVVTLALINFFIQTAS